MEFGTDLTECARVVADGGVAVVATDTLYGLVADIRCQQAVGRVLAIKGREAGRGVPVLVKHAVQAAEITAFTDEAKLLADAFWPGGLTLVLPTMGSVDRRLHGPGSTVGIRVPDSEIVGCIIDVVGAPITGTSANLSGQAPAATAREAADMFGNAVDYVLDTAVGAAVASTIINLSQKPPIVIREGVIAMPELRVLVPDICVAADEV